MKRYLVGEHFYNRNETFAGIVYYIKNKVNGKGYVGQTTLPMNLRWNVHISDAHNKDKNLFTRAIRKYGPDSFEVNIIAYCKTQVELDAVEAGFIRGFKTLALGGGGYNVLEGSHRSGKRTQCKRGHSLLDPSNIHIDGSGCRRCYVCLKENWKRIKYTSSGIAKERRRAQRRTRERALRRQSSGLPLSPKQIEALEALM